MPGYARESGGPHTACVQTHAYPLCPGCTLSLWLGQTCYIYEEQRNCIERVMLTETPAPDRAALHQAGLQLGPAGATLQSAMTSYPWEFHYGCDTYRALNCTQWQVDLATRLQKLVECEHHAQETALSQAYFLLIFLAILAFVLIVTGLTMFVMYARQRNAAREEDDETCCGEQQPLLTRVQ